MKKVISCSRRTDIPMHYYEWLQSALRSGSIELKNYFSGKMYTVDLSPKAVHSIVLWSKDYSHLLEDPGELSKYNLYFQFTITGYNNVMEPGIRPLNETLEQLKALSEKYSPEQINWRFDPIIFNNGFCENHDTNGCYPTRLCVFHDIAEVAKSCGITRCTFSFMDFYKKARQVFEHLGVEVCPMYSDRSGEEKVIFEPEMALKQVFTEEMVQIASECGIQLYSCSEPEIQKIKGVKKSQCIDGALLGELFGDRASVANDSSQRKACGCTKSTDIGSYKQPCPNRCLYCYANAPKFTVEN